MNKLDNQIYSIFCSLINTGDKYFESINYLDSRIIYKVGNKIIELFIYPSNKQEIPSNSYTTAKRFAQFSQWFPFDFTTGELNDDQLRFSLIIDNKRYFVPKLDRMTLAKALNTLDKLFADKEYKTLESINRSFDEYSND